MDNKAYVMVPYGEYQEFLELKRINKEEEGDLILLERLLIEQEGVRWPKCFINELESSVRCHNVLREIAKEKRIDFVGDLISLEESYVLRFQNLGRKTLTELRELLMEKGLKFGTKLPQRVINKMELLRNDI